MTRSGNGRGTGDGDANNEFLAALAANMQGMNNQQQQFQLQMQQQFHQFQMQQQNHHLGQGGNRGLDDFCRRKPPRFEGGFAPDAAHHWIQELEKIFRALQCADDLKVTYATYMLSKEAEDWWGFAQQQMENDHQVVTWEAFKNRFFRKYFPTDLRVQKEMEFLDLKQGNLSLSDYINKFEALAKYAPHYNQPGDERTKCAKFENGLRPELNLAFAHQQIEDFAKLASKCRIYEEGLKVKEAAREATMQQKTTGGPTRNTYGQRSSWIQGKTPYNPNQKPYVAPSGSQEKGFQPNNNKQQKAPMENSNNNSAPRCNKCNFKHHGPDCVVCYNCNKPGHIRTHCPQLNGGSGNAAKPQFQGKIFTMSGEEVEVEENEVEENEVKDDWNCFP